MYMLLMIARMTTAETTLARMTTIEAKLIGDYDIYPSLLTLIVV
jgi:hypothetical protein